jgi:hypothetical protein
MREKHEEAALPQLVNVVLDTPGLPYAVEEMPI